MSVHVYQNSHWRSDNSFREATLSLHLMSPKDWTEGIRLAQPFIAFPLLLFHLTSRENGFLIKELMALGDGSGVNSITPSTLNYSLPPSLFHTGSWFSGAVCVSRRRLRWKCGHLRDTASDPQEARREWA